VLLGTIEPLGDHDGLLIEPLNISHDKVGPQEATVLSIPDPKDAFSPFEPYNEWRAP
jgi:hypothetical protein